MGPYNLPAMTSSRYDDQSYTFPGPVILRCLSATHASLPFASRQFYKWYKVGTWPDPQIQVGTAQSIRKQLP